jgi:hypothetical protein
MRLKKSDETGQMLIWETIFFATIVCLSIVFLYRLSPPSNISDEYSYDLKIQGDGALLSIYNDVVLADRPFGYPASKLEHYLITNSYGDMVKDLNVLLPPTVLYNIYVSNGTKTVFWCNSYGDYSTVLPKTDSVVVSHCIVAMNLNSFSESAHRALMYSHVITPRYPGESTEKSDLIHLFIKLPTTSYYGSVVFEIKLEMWFT